MPINRKFVKRENTFDVPDLGDLARCIKEYFRRINCARRLVIDLNISSTNEIVANKISENILHLIKEDKMILKIFVL